MSYRADKLVIDTRTDTHTHRQTQATTIPEGQYWPRVKTQMKSMELKLDEHEQYSRRSTLRMSGVPESPEEDTTAEVMNILNKKLNLSPPISIDNIDRLHRVGKPGGSHPRHILVKFSTYRARQHVYSQKKKLRTKNSRETRTARERHEKLARDTNRYWIRIISISGLVSLYIS